MVAVLLVGSHMTVNNTGSRVVKLELGPHSGFFSSYRPLISPSGEQLKVSMV